MPNVGQFGSEAILTNAGAIQPGAVCTIRDPGGGVSVLYTDLTGSATTANPLPLDSAGNLLAYAAPGPHTVNIGAVSRTVMFVAASTGMQLGKASTATPFTMTNTLTGIPGLSVPCVVPAGLDVYLEAFLPQVQCTVGVGGIANVSLFLLEDGTTIQSEAQTMAVNTFLPGRIALPSTRTAGAHTYTVACQATSGATVTMLAGAGNVPYLRVTAG